MRCQPDGTAFIQLPTTSAFSLCDGLLRIAHRLMIELPEPELRDIRYTLDALSTRVDQLLESAELDYSLNFDGLSIDPERDCSYVPGAEDFGAVMIPTTVSAGDGSGPTTSSSSRRRNTVSRVPPPATIAPSTPVPTPAPLFAPTPVPVRVPTPASTPTHGSFPLVLSSRENVGFPDYTYHPDFVRPGIPGAYQTPPTASKSVNLNGYYVVSKGLYAGIFTDWDEVGAWVLGVSGSLFRKTKSWQEARDLYNARLAAGAVQILS